MMFPAVFMLALSAYASPEDSDSAIANPMRWKELPGSLVQAKINADGSIWGINQDDQIYYCADNKKCDWKKAEGGLTQISSVNTDGNNGFVCGTNQIDDIYCSSFGNQNGKVSWKGIPGKLISVSVNQDSSLWGANRNNQIYYCRNWNDCQWKQVPGALNQISSFTTTRSRGYVCGVNSSDEIYCGTYKREFVTWRRIQGSLTYVSVGFNHTLFGVNHKDEIYFCPDFRDCTLRRLSGKLTQIDGSAGNVCGTNESGKIYCARNLLTTY